jgi:hypothetical protein
MENKYSIQIKCFQNIDVDGIEDKLWVVIARANWKLLLSISMLLNLSK